MKKLLILTILIFSCIGKKQESKQIGLQIIYKKDEMFSDSIYVVESRDFLVLEKPLIDSLNRKVVEEGLYPNLSFIPYITQKPLTYKINKDTAQDTFYYFDSFDRSVLKTFISRIEKNKIYLGHKSSEMIKQKVNSKLQFRKSVIKIKIPPNSKFKYHFLSNFVG